MTRICFLDTETTSLRPDRRAWEAGLIVRDPGRPDRERQWFIRTEDLDLGNADVMSLKIGRFYERHPSMIGMTNRMAGEAEVMAEVEKLTRGAHIVGAVPNFDTEVLGARMRANDTCPSWHYHLVDIEALAVGYLAGSPAFGQSQSGSKREEIRELITPPWKSDALSAALGIEVSDEERHTALGDARWARDIYDAVMSGPS